MSIGMTTTTAMAAHSKTKPIPKDPQRFPPSGSKESLNTASFALLTMFTPSRHSQSGLREYKTAHIFSTRTSRWVGIGLEYYSVLARAESDNPTKSQSACTSRVSTDFNSPDGKC